MAQSVKLKDGSYIDESGVYATEYGMTLKEALSIVLADGAGAHNSLYRGKYLGSAVTDAQYAAIADGTFRGLYIGDYWTIGGVNYRLAGFDYCLNNGDTDCTTHHAVVVPDAGLYNAQMNATETTDGGYVGSTMYTANLATAKSTIKSAFSGHVLKHRVYLTNAASNGRASSGAWYDSEVELMTEQMAHGGSIFGSVSDGSSVPFSYRIEKSQLPLFTLEPSRLSYRSPWWLRDVATAVDFAYVDYSGSAYYNRVTYSLGVRPYFCIY